MCVMVQLHALIMQGRTDVKQIIISAIISTVQQPGSMPPSDVPALMNILRSAAEEQLGLVQDAEDMSALQAALEFGAWHQILTLAQKLHRLLPLTSLSSEPPHALSSPRPTRTLSIPNRWHCTLGRSLDQASQHHAR